MRLPAQLFDAFTTYIHSRLQLLEGSKPVLEGPWMRQAAQVLEENELLRALSLTELNLLLLALLPQVYPDFLNHAILETFPAGGDLPLLGGVKGQNHRGLLPTGETALALFAGTVLTDRLAMQACLQPDETLTREGLLYLENVKEGEPSMSGRLIVPQNIADQLLLGREPAPRFSLEFPAQKVTTAMSWEDVVLPLATRVQIEDMGTWLAHHTKITADENLSRKVKPGYRVLFYGPPGTGKTLTAALLGKEYHKEVYRIDLSQLVSKYIGETEKNLEALFRRAERKDWILFFDEADALFGKRTNVQTAHDKYANQEVSYLLQRVEDYNGLLILASNFKSNLDDAFVRRFHALIHFPMPNAQERLRLWQKSLPASLALEEQVDLTALVAQYELSGAGILNTVHYATLQAYGRSGNALTLAGLMDGIRKEFLKEERSL